MWQGRIVKVAQKIMEFKFQVSWVWIFSDYVNFKEIVYVVPLTAFIIDDTPSDQVWFSAAYASGRFRSHSAMPTDQIFCNSGWSALILSGIRFHRNLAAHLKKNT